MREISFSSEIQKVLNPFVVADGAHDRLFDAYNESWRTYHNSNHIMHMLERSRQSDICLNDDELQRLGLMILYHDAWYKVGRTVGENERRSAYWANDDLISDCSDETIRLCSAVMQGIIATTTHSLDNIDSCYVKEVGILLDLDLWGLGQEPEAFKRDTEKVWGEYQTIVTREEFDAGRSDWARTILESGKPIYHTQLFLEREEMALKNLKELAG